MSLHHASRTLDDSPSSDISPMSQHSDVSADSPAAVRLSASPPASLDVKSPKGGSGSIPAGAMSPGPQSPTLQPLTLAESVAVLTAGDTFTKFAGRRSALLSFVGVGGAPVQRFVFLDKTQGSMGSIYWSKVPAAGKPPVKDAARCIPLAHVTGLYEQAETEAFASSKQGQALSPTARSLCFSIVTKDRTLDLQASSMKQRDTWMHAIHQILVHSGYNVSEEVVGAPSSTRNMESPHPGGIKGSPTSGNQQSQNTPGGAATKRPSTLGELHVSSPASSSSSSVTSPNANVGQMLSPPPNAAPANSPMSSIAGGMCTPANSPVVLQQGGSAAGGAKTNTNTNALPSAEVLDDPLAASQLQFQLIPHEDSAEGQAHGQGQLEIPSSLSVPGAGALALPIAQQVFSPSEHPTKTPASSPVNA